MKLTKEKKQLREIGMAISFTDHEGYRVNFITGREASAYYTDDLDDAMATAIAISGAKK